MLEESNAFTMVFLDLSSLQTNLYTRLRITDWQHWVFVIAQVALVLSNLDLNRCSFLVCYDKLFATCKLTFSCSCSSTTSEEYT